MIRFEAVTFLGKHRLERRPRLEEHLPSNTLDIPYSICLFHHFSLSIVLELEDAQLHYI